MGNDGQPGADKRLIGPEAYAALLRGEVEHYDKLIRDHQNRMEAIRLFAFSAAGLLASYLVARPNYWILLLLPIAVFAAYFNGLHSAGEMRALTAHKTHLERKLRTLLWHHLPEEEGRPPGTWELGGGYVRVRSLSVIALEVFYGFAVIVVPAICVAAAWVKLGDLWWLALIDAMTCLALAILAVLVWRTVLETYDRTMECLEAQSSLS